VILVPDKGYEEERMEDLNSGRTHKVTMTNRRSCIINGVNDVLSFDIHEILLETEQGMLMIKGNDLHVNRLMLDKGEVDVDGKIDSFTYSDVAVNNHQNESFLTKLFR
jgi:sporulation protein YabP